MFNLKNPTGFDTSDFPKNADPANVKSEIGKFHIDKLEKVPNSSNSLNSKVDKWDVYKLVHISVDLKKLSDIVINDR